MEKQIQVKDLLNLNIKMLVEGYSYHEQYDKETNKPNGVFHTKLQSIIYKELENGDIEEKTMELKVLSKIDGEKVMGKVIEAQNIIQIGKAPNYYYKTSKIKLCDEKIAINFDLNKSIKLTISNVSITTFKDKKTNEEKTTYSLFARTKLGTQLKSLKIKIKEGATTETLRALKGKKVLLNHFNITNMDFNEYYNVSNINDIKTID